MKVFPKWWRVHFLWVELIIVTLLAGFFAWWVAQSGGDVIDASLKGDRGPLYSALASIWGALLGFVITAISIVLGYANDPRLKVLRDSKHYAQLWTIFVGASRTLGVATIAALGGLIFDRMTIPNHLCLEICLWASLLATARLARCLWALQGIIKIVSIPPAGNESTQTLRQSVS